MAVVKSVLQLGASVAVQSLSGNSSLGGETALTIAGRAGHMNIFEELLKAGAPVNVQNRDTGETPLVSTARWDFVADVQLLVSSGGALRYEDVLEVDRCPLIPSTLEAMKKLCLSTVEFNSICGRVVARLQGMCCQLQALGPGNIQDGALVTFANILFRVCRLQLDVEKQKSPLSRFIKSHAVVNKIYSLHEELDHFADLLGLKADPTSVNVGAWKAHWGEDRSLLFERFGTKLTKDETLMSGYNDNDDDDDYVEKNEAAVLLQSEFEAHAREGNGEHQEIVRKIRDRFFGLTKLETPVLPAWFISREDVEIQSWKIMPSSRDDFTPHYEGKWRETNVRIETTNWLVDESASRWFDLSHPNVVKLFGACNIGEPQFFVYELMRGGKELLEILHDDELNRGGVMWKCLYQAALGLRYIHSLGLAHGDLRPEHILVGPNLVTKLTGLHDDPDRFDNEERSKGTWMAKEWGKDDVWESAALDIYAFGMCIWETLTRELPRKGMRYSDIMDTIREGQPPDRPSIMTDDEWDLITKICKPNPAERVEIDFVVNRLAKFVFDSDTQRTNEMPSRSLSDHLFSELNGWTIPETLDSMAFKCAQLPEETKWMSKSALPALEFMFDLLQQQKKTVNGIETVQFAIGLSSFKRHLRTTLSENSTRRCARSRKVAETNYVVYAELDRLLDMLDVSEVDPIRRWKQTPQQDEAELGGPSDQAASKSSYWDVPAVIFDTWCLPPLYDISSPAFGYGSFGAVHHGSWVSTPVVVKFMRYEEDKDTIPIDVLLHRYVLRLTQSQKNVKEHCFSELNGSTIPKMLKRVTFKCGRLSKEDQWMAKCVLPALEFMFALLQQSRKTVSDIETVQFAIALSNFHRHLCTTLSTRRCAQCARSRKIAEANGVVYTELDRLLDMLEVSAADPIRRWMQTPPQQEEAELDSPINQTSNEGVEGDVSVIFFEMSSTNHELWTLAGLKMLQTPQPWTLPLKDVIFKESDQIGRGAFGEVFKGSRLGTPVVIKLMGYKEDKDSIPTDLLLHEVRVWHRLNHPHVLRLYGANHLDKRYFVCEFASGGELLEFLKKPGNGKLKWQKLYEAALSLQYLHGQNVAHNDLKCDNIMVGADDNAKLIDFGLSCLLNEAEIKIKTKAMGAVNWRSPEYLAGGRPSFASDVYSFAMCIIEVISGDIPWGSNLVAAAVRFQLGKGNSPNLPASMNDKQRNLIKLMAKKEPSERVRMGFVVDKLSEIARDESLGDATP